MIGVFILINIVLFFRVNMYWDYFLAMMLSASPFGEAKAGIPYGLFQGANIYLIFILCLFANILIFPLMYFFLQYINRHLFKWRAYKKASIYVAKRARDGARKGIRRYGYWGLAFFVMLPFPGTGVYAGTIASYILGFDKKKSFVANSIGITLSSIIVWGVSVASLHGLS